MLVLQLLTVLATDSAQSVTIPVAPRESLHVVAAGSGRPVVLIPGFFGSAFTFRKITPALNAAGYRTLVVEPLGIGGSSRPEKGDYSLTAQARRIGAALDSLGVTSAIVVAHSNGGSIAMRLAVHRPTLVDGLVSIEGGPTESAVTPSFRSALRFAPWIKLLGGVKLIRWKIRHVLLDSSGDKSWVTDDVVTGYTAPAAVNLTATLKAYLAMAASPEPEKLAPRLREISCPVRLMVGGAKHDGDVGTREVVLLQRALPNFVLDSVAGAGHFLQEERPDVVVDVIEHVVGSRGSSDLIDANRTHR
ncbi:MAG TPA: alpha/beta hydrolase [Gemmatimonadales bacterium]